MTSIDEKRVYADREGAVDAYVASDAGVVRIRVADDVVGEFSLVERAVARDVAAGTDCVVAATDDGVLVADLASDDPAFEPTGFGPAVAVGVGVDVDVGPDDAGRSPADSHLATRNGDRVVAASADGRVAVRGDGADGWRDLGTDAPSVRAIDGDLLATADGVYRIREGRLAHAGLADAADVSAAGVPLAATADGLYRLGNGWMDVFEGGFDVVAADPRVESGRLGRAHAVAGHDWYGHVDGTWQAEEPPESPVAGVAYAASATYAVTRDGTVLAASDDGDGAGARADEREWRSRALGVGSVAGLAIPSPR